MTGILLNEIPFQIRRRTSRFSKRCGWAIAAVGFFKKLVPLQLQHQLLEHRAHLRSDAESFSGESHSDFRTHFAETSAKQCRREVILRGNRAFQAILSAKSNHVGERSLCRFAQTS